MEHAPPFLFVRQFDRSRQLQAQFVYLIPNFRVVFADKIFVGEERIVRDLENRESRRFVCIHLIGAFKTNASDRQPGEVSQENIKGKHRSVDLVKISILSDLAAFESLKHVVFRIVEVDLYDLPAVRYGIADLNCLPKRTGPGARVRVTDPTDPQSRMFDITIEDLQMATGSRKWFGKSLDQEASAPFDLRSFVHFAEFYYTRSLHSNGLMERIMRYRSFLGLLLTIVAIAAAACGGGASNSSNASNASNSGNSANGNATSTANSPVETTKKPIAETTNNAPTIGPVVQAYYDALKKKDDAALMNVLSAAFVKSIQADMKAEKKTGMAAYLAEYDTIPDKPVEVRNEKIEGDKAVAELKGGAYLNWTAFSFINEGGKWKFTGGSPDIQTVTSGSNSNKSK